MSGNPVENQKPAGPENQPEKGHEGHARSDTAQPVRGPLRRPCRHVRLVAVCTRVAALA